MADTYGDALAIEVAKRIGRSVATVTALNALPADERVDGRVHVVTADNSLWAYRLSDNTFIPAGVGAGPGPEYVQEFTDPAAAAAAGLKAATAMTVSPLTILTASLLAPGIAALLAYPRNLTFTTAGGTAADAPATVLITGTDINDAALTETVSLAQTATIAAGVKCFKTVTSLAFAAADGTGATVAIGFGAVFGLAKKAKVRAGGVAVKQEIAVGVPVATGTFVIPATSPPNGSYAPSTAPDASRDYAIYFERDLS